MGLRGPGAGRRRAVAQSGDKSQAFPWLEPGLDRVERVIAFLEYLPITKGKLQGEKMTLLPSQREFVEAVYGRKADDGTRLTKLAVLSEPKGNGKTGLTAGLCLCHLFGPECEPRGEVYSAAIDRDQAGIMFEEMEATILAVPSFAGIVNIQRFKKHIEVLSGDGEGSKYEALSSDARGAHGRAPSLWVYDELAQARDRRLLDNLLQGMSKRDESLGIVLSTQAPDDGHPLSELIDDGLTGNDPTTYVQLICAPEEADPFAEDTLRSCNPAWGTFLDITDLMNAARRAKRIPSMEPGFRNLRLNQRVHATADDLLLTATLWKHGNVQPLIRSGMECFGGLDLSGKHDLTALVLAFPSEEDDPAYGLLSFFWTPDGQLSGRKPAEEDLFRLWIKQGHLSAIPGQVIRYHQIAAKVGEILDLYEVQGIAYDRYRVDDLKAEMSDLDIPTDVLVPWGQGYKDMSPAVEKVHELALAGKLFHGNNPVLTACVSNARITRDPAGNMKIDKSKAPSGSIRIDGAVAMAMAIGLASRTRSSYAQGTLLAV